MNQLQLRRAGMGAPDPWDYPIDDPIFGQPGITNTPPINSAGQYSPFKIALPGLIAGGLRVVDDIFADPRATQARYGSQYAGQLSNQRSLIPPGYTYNAAGQLVPLANPTTAGITNAGLNLLGVQIPWTVVGIVGLILFFPGFQRRR